MRGYWLIAILFSWISSQSISDNPFIGPESTALVGATVSKTNSPLCIYYNPAGLSGFDNMKFNVSGGNLYGLNWLPQVQTGISFPIKGLGNFGISYYGLTTEIGAIDLSQEQTISIGHGIFLQSDVNSTLSLGWTANYYLWEQGESAGQSGDGFDGIDGFQESVVGIDLGVQASLRKRYRFGVMIKNINSPTLGQNMSMQYLPRRMTVGIAYLPTRELTTMINLERLLGRDDIQVKGGVEYAIHPYVILRVGAQSNPNRMGVGCSIKFGEINLSYGLLTHPVLPISQQFSLGLEF